VKILALDTTREFGSLALVDSGAVVDEILIHSPEGFSPILFDRVDQLLRAHGWTVGAVDCYAAASGPGSFTGVRVGLAAVKGLAEATGKPAIAVSNLQALALFGSEPLRATIIDARRGEIYGGVYDAELRPVTDECVSKFPAWLERLPASAVEFIGTDLGPFRASLSGTRFERAKVTEAPRAQAAAVGRIACARLNSGEAQEPAALDANYVRRSDAELFWKE
jgi:tRNA threonylcarbamoyladenosine biosynthesis protein TsaB